MESETVRGAGQYRVPPPVRAWHHWSGENFKG